MMKAMAKEAATGVLPVGDLGSGSDYSPFLQHVGVASMNLGFGGEGSSGGVYHSAYDSFDHYDRFGDPGFHYGVALSEVAGRVVMRMADADLLPLRFDNLAAYGLPRNRRAEDAGGSNAQGTGREPLQAHRPGRLSPGRRSDRDMGAAGGASAVAGARFRSPRRGGRQAEDERRGL